MMIGLISLMKGIKRGLHPMFALVGILIFSIAVLAQSNRDVLKDTLSNGMRVVIVRNAISPVVTTEINYLVGSDEAPQGFPGTAHALEHMMFRGSDELSAAQLANISAALGGDFNADTQQMVTQYFFTVPSDYLDVALRIEAIRMKSIAANDSLWNQERGAIEQEVAQDMSNPQYVFYTKLLEAMFKGTPYAHDALGTRASFDSTTAAMLQEFHKKWYVPNNAVLVIVGDVQPEKTLQEVKELFGAIPPGRIPQRPQFDFQPVVSDTLNLTTDYPYGFVVISFRFPGSDSPDYAAAQVLADVLSNQRGSLYSLVPQGKALYAGFAFGGFVKSGLGYAVAVFPKGSNTNSLLQDVRGVLEEIVRNGVSADLVEAAKRHEIAAAEFQKNSVSGLASVWSDAVAIEGRQSPEDDLDAIKKVTVEDVNRVAKRYLDFNHCITAILSPQASGKPISTASFGGRESFAPKETKYVKLPSWAEKALRRLEVPKSNVNPEVLKLSNGLTLIFQPESVSNTVTVVGHIKNEPYLQTPKGKDGVANVLGRLFEYGTLSLDRVAFQKALDDIGADESAGTDFSLNVLADRFDSGMALLADNLLHPALPETAFKVVQRQTAAAVAGQLESPDYLMNRALKRALYPDDDPTLRETTPATVSGLSLDDVKAFYNHVFRPDQTTIVVVGKIDPDSVKDVVKKYFGSWKAEGEKPGTLLPPVPLNKPASVNVPDISRVQDKVTLSETLGLVRSNPDYYALQLGNHVLGGAFYATRLYQDLREKTGLVYYVSSTFDIGQTRSTYSVHYGCDPDKVSVARNIIIRDLKQMQFSLVSQDELKQAKAALLREIPLSESSLGGIANGLLYRSTHDLPLNEPTIAAKNYVKLNANDVQAAFKKWLRPDDFVEVTEGPVPK
ncbi:MAG: M16 family metallopeptidase [Candidatus Kryptoniota bacterium]